MHFIHRILGIIYDWLPANLKKGYKLLLSLFIVFFPMHLGVRIILVQQLLIMFYVKDLEPQDNSKMKSLGSVIYLSSAIVIGVLIWLGHITVDSIFGIKEVPID